MTATYPTIRHTLNMTLSLEYGGTSQIPKIDGESMMFRKYSR